jgi:hypothetical protein
MNGIQEKRTYGSVQNAIVPIGTKQRGGQIKNTHRCCFCHTDKERECFRVFRNEGKFKLSSRCFECEPEYNRSRQRIWTGPNRNPYPEKNHARDLVKTKIRQGIIIPQPCEKCGSRGQSHHDDYSKPLEIRWLCTKHHGEVHRIYK